jgi:hypothetical protein
VLSTLAQHPREGFQPAGGAPTAPQARAGGRLDLQDQLFIADTLQHEMRSARMPMERIAVHLNMDLRYLRDDDWRGLVRVVHAGVHRSSGDGADAVKGLIRAAAELVPGNVRVAELLKIPGKS